MDEWVVCVLAAQGVPRDHGLVTGWGSPACQDTMDADPSVYIQKHTTKTHPAGLGLRPRHTATR
jgi:hypothetical protein